MTDNHSGVDAFVEITITAGMLTAGFLGDRALRQIKAACHSIAAGIHVTVHLGPLTRPDEELCKFLASLPCPISFGGTWKAATAAQQRVTELRARPA
jgi:hypothetical protein